MYYGRQKPNEANSILREFVNEAIDLVNNGFIYQERKYTFKIKFLVFDAPAKSLFTYTRGHTGYSSCSKCHIRGVYEGSNVCFPETENIVLRSDLDFRAKVDDRHHTGTFVVRADTR